MDFTREPIIESVVTPKEGCKLVVRSSKGGGQEEFFVDSVEVVSFGNTFFLRSLERPKSFLVPASDYEILEVRETRMVLKNVGFDRSIKIAGGREAPKRAAKGKSKATPAKEPAAAPEAKPEPKRKERRRSYRRKRGEVSKGNEPREEGSEEKEKGTPSAVKMVEPPKGLGEAIAPSAPSLSSLLPPPPTLISETIEKYKEDELFKGVFYPKDENVEGGEPLQVVEEEEAPVPNIFLEEPPAEESSSEGAQVVEEKNEVAVEPEVETTEEQPSADSAATEE